MKVLVYTSLFPNHLQPNNAVFIKQRMFEFAKLDNCGIKVVAPVPYFPYLPSSGRWQTFARIMPWEEIEGIEVFHPRYPLLPKVSMHLHGLSMFLASAGLIKKVHSQYPFDIIDAHYVYPDGFSAILLGKLFRKPVVLSARGSDINQFSKLPTIRPMIRYALTHARHAISVSNALKSEMVSLGIANNRITVIPNGVNLDKFTLQDRSIARAHLGIDPNAKVILSVGLLIPRKGVHVTLQALHEVVRRHGNVKFYVIGEGSYRKELENLVEKLHLGHSVHLIGERPNHELSSWYSAADVFCLASSREGWANVIMESLACGTPVVATNVYGAPEILTSEMIGHLVERTPESIAQGLINALSHRWDRQRIRSHVENRTWKKTAQEVRELFISIMK